MDNAAVLIGFSLTRHCNLRCTHCIRDDVTRPVELSVAVVLRVLREARDVVGGVEAAFTGGEPLLHREWGRLADGLRAQAVPYSFVSNGWHMRRFIPVLDRYPPRHVRLSLSGADAEVHDAERGRDSFRRVLLATALLTSRRVPVSYSLIVDRRTRHQLEKALALGTQMGCAAVRYILPQPVPASADRATDLPPAEWWAVRRELEELGRAAWPSATRVVLEYGAPFTGPETLCESKALRRIYVDVHGRLSTCCQLSEYGGTETDVVADLTARSFASAYTEQVRRLAELERASEPRGPHDPLGPFPCLRCARASGKLAWLRAFPDSPWAAAGAGVEPIADAPVSIGYSRRARRVVAHSS